MHARVRLGDKVFLLGGAACVSGGLQLQVGLHIAQHGADELRQHAAVRRDECIVQQALRRRSRRQITLHNNTTSEKTKNYDICVEMMGQKGKASRNSTHTERSRDRFLKSSLIAQKCLKYASIALRYRFDSAWESNNSACTTEVIGKHTM